MYTGIYMPIFKKVVQAIHLKSTIDDTKLLDNDYGGKGEENDTVSCFADCSCLHLTRLLQKKQRQRTPWIKIIFLHL